MQSIRCLCREHVWAWLAHASHTPCCRCLFLHHLLGLIPHAALFACMLA